MRSLCFLGCASLLALGCDVGPSSSTAPRAELELAGTDGDFDPLVLRSRQLALRMQGALARLSEPMPPATRFGEQKCPDQAIEGSSARATLTLTTHDARYSARSLLPLRVTRPLESREAASLNRYFEADQTRLSSPLLRELRSEADAEAVTRAIEQLEQRAFKGVFHIVLFKKPHLIRKQNRRRREWTKGVLQAWLVVYDIDASEPLCQTRVTAVSDVDDEPISIRLRAETQRKLVAELGHQLRREARHALASISQTLTIADVATQPGKLAQAQPPGMQ